MPVANLADVLILLWLLQAVSCTTASSSSSMHRRPTTRALIEELDRVRKDLASVQAPLPPALNAMLAPAELLTRNLWRGPTVQ